MIGLDRHAPPPPESLQSRSMCEQFSFWKGGGQALISAPFFFEYE